MLLRKESNHLIYQKLFDIVPPFYAHFISYLLNVVKPSPASAIYVEDYDKDLIRNLLSHASQISFKTLIYLYCTLFMDTD
jgi:hypothetical protein